MECKKRIEFFRGTTPSIRINQGENIKFADISKLILTLEQGKYEVNKEVEITNPEITQLSIPLTEEETLGFKEGDGQLQIKILMTDGKVWSHRICRFSVNKILNEEILNSGD